MGTGLAAKQPFNIFQQSRFPAVFWVQVSLATTLKVEQEGHPNPPLTLPKMLRWRTIITRIRSRPAVRRTPRVNCGSEVLPPMPGISGNPTAEVLPILLRCQHRLQRQPPQGAFRWKPQVPEKDGGGRDIRIQTPKKNRKYAKMIQNIQNDATWPC